MISKKHTYIIDDDRIFVYGLRKILEINNICKKVDVFANGQLAINNLVKLGKRQVELPDLILLDINMPVLDGWQFLDEFAILFPKPSKKIIIYLVSSSIDPSDISKAKTYSSVNNYIVKPIKLELLKKALKEDSY